MELNSIIVIRVSDRPLEMNPILNRALHGHYVVGKSQVFPIITGGFISTLQTEDTFEQIIEVITEARCGDDIVVLDTNSPILRTKTIFARDIKDIAKEDTTGAIVEDLIKKHNEDKLLLEQLLSD